MAHIPASKKEEREEMEGMLWGHHWIYSGHFHLHPIGQNIITWSHMSCRGNLGNVVFIAVAPCPSSSAGSIRRGG